MTSMLFVVLGSLGCSNQIELISGVGPFGHLAQLFEELTTNCYGRIVAINLYATNTGTFSLDLWKPVDNNDYVLYYTMQVQVETPGPVSVPAAEEISVEPGLAIGFHIKPSNNMIAYVNDAKYTARRYDVPIDDSVWQPGVLLYSSFTRYENLYRRPSLGVEISPFLPNGGGNYCQYSITCNLLARGPLLVYH